jgi:small ligand-binding sensory domain FIST
MNDKRAFALGHASSANWQEAMDSCLAQLGDIPDEANLGFVYVADSYANYLQDIYERLRNATAIQHWTGTVGISICATATEYHQTSAMAVMIGDFPADSFRVLPFYNRAADHLPGGWEDWLQASPSHLAVIHGDPTNANVPQLLGQLYDELPGGYLVGGLSSSHGANPQIAGCTPRAGKPIRTACDSNLINDLDQRPALDVLNEDIGEILARDLNRAAGYIFAGLPVESSDTDDYLVRNLIGIDTEGKRIAIGDMIRPGQKIQFCRRDGKTAQQDMQRMLDDLKNRINGTPRGGLYYSCLGRGEALFGEDSAELKMIQATLGDFPLVGFFANGEIFNQRLYGYTGVLTLFV